MTQAEISKLFLNMLEASTTTLQIFFLTLIFALPLGLIVTLGRMSKQRVVNVIVRVYLLVVRGTPLLLQLLFVYFGYAILLNIRIERFTAAIIAMSLNYAAYFAEIYRSGIESMPKGQYEAAKVLGFSKGQTFFKIILPQVIKRILPPMGNEFMTLVKDTALVTCIGVSEVYQLANKTVSEKGTMIPLVMAGVFYLVMNGVVSKVVQFFEKKLSYYR